MARFEPPRRLTRRSFLAVAAIGVSAGAPSQIDDILARIKAPVFPSRDFEITKFGAVADGEKPCTEAIRKAIAACTQAGGGRVVVPRGTFLTGAIHLTSNVNLHLADGARLAFSRDPKDYLPLVFTRFEGTECMNYSPFLYAFEQTNVAITGPGTLDGQADDEHWWSWKKRAERKQLVAMGDKNAPVSERVFGEGRYLRPNFIQPYRSKNILIEGITIVNSPMWEINPVLCRNVTVRGVNISSHGPNNDGCDPECCTDTLVEDCVFDTGDDCIAIKSGRNQDGRRVNAPCENLVIRGCTMKDGHGGVSIGSEVSGNVRNVFIEHCEMSSPHLERALRIKSNSYRGGTVENVVFRNIKVGQVSDAVVQIDLYYEEGPGGPYNPTVRNVTIEDVTCNKSKYGLHFRGYESAPIRDVRVEHCRFNNVAEPMVIENVKGLTLEDVSQNGKPLHS
ncbi:MAG TPA: glycoside hydrolase family 28 protein [Bryobacteraceae bacterium]|nr:glycoside hydrolase family 28 protein [Bryobacteraceae bacterium]